MPRLITDYLFYKKLKRMFGLREPIRNKHLLAFSQMKSCLILFNASDEKESQIIFSIIRELQNEGKQVRSVGYVQYKNNPHWCFPKISYDYLNAKNISLSGLPKADFVNDIIETKFDMLIDFLNNPIPAMCYISALSNASVKISRNRSQNDFFTNVYDFIIENQDLNNRDFYEEVKRYLLLLKP
jgi:hypothetical protein